jgi:hypothetical protein
LGRVSGHTYEYALVAQRIERCPAEAEAVGSNPAKRTILCKGRTAISLIRLACRIL